MVKIVIIEKNGNIKTSNVKQLSLSNLHKKCKVRNEDGFDCRAIWTNGDYKVGLFANNDGKAKSENKYDLPPPIDSDLFFDNMAAVKFEGDLEEENFVDFTGEEWGTLYDVLMGGFEDLDSDGDAEEEDEMANIPKELLTQHGYMKDGFVVEDDDVALMSDVTDDEEEEYLTSSEVGDSDDDDTFEGDETSAGMTEEESEEESDCGSTGKIEWKGALKNKKINKKIVFKKDSDEEGSSSEEETDTTDSEGEVEDELKEESYE